MKLRTEVSGDDADKAVKENLAYFENKSGENPYTLHQELQEMMHTYAGIIRTETDLTLALSELSKFDERAKKMSQAIPAFRIDHVYREQNREADLLANEAMDEVSGKAPGGESRNSKIGDGNSKTENRNAPANPNPTIKVRARVRSGILYPLEDVDLPDGAEVEILLRPTTKS